MILLFPVLLVLFLVLGLWLAHRGGWWAYKKYHHVFAYIGGFALVLVLVFGDEVFGHYYWQHLCKTEGGLHVYKKVPVDGFWYDEGAADSVAADFFRRKGYEYSYIEGKYSRNYGKDSNKLYRYSLDDSKHMIRTEITTPKSFYIYTDESVSYPHFIWGHNATVRDVKNRELIGVHRLIGYKGGVIRRALLKFVGAQEGSASYCGNDGGSVIKAAIPPIQSKNIKKGSKS